MNPVAKRAGARRRARGVRGFTLIELMIVVVIVGILAAIAYPSYRNQVRETRRTDGQAALVDTAQRLERCYTRYNSYDNAGCDIAEALDDGGSFATPEGWYSISASALNASAFTLVATAQDDQASDAECGNLGITNTGARTATGTAADDDCW